MGFRHVPPDGPVRPPEIMKERPVELAKLIRCRRSTPIAAVLS